MRSGSCHVAEAAKLCRNGLHEVADVASKASGALRSVLPTGHIRASEDSNGAADMSMQQQRAAIGFDVGFNLKELVQQLEEEVARKERKPARNTTRRRMSVNLGHMSGVLPGTMPNEESLALAFAGGIAKRMKRISMGFEDLAGSAAAAFSAAPASESFNRRSSPDSRRSSPDSFGRASRRRNSRSDPSSSLAPQVGDALTTTLAPCLSPCLAAFQRDRTELAQPRPVPRQRVEDAHRHQPHWHTQGRQPSWPAPRRPASGQLLDNPGTQVQGNRSAARAADGEHDAARAGTCGGRRPRSRQHRRRSRRRAPRTGVLPRYIAAWGAGHLCHTGLERRRAQATAGGGGAQCGAYHAVIGAVGLIGRDLFRRQHIRTPG